MISSKKTVKSLLFLVVFIDLIGFGIFITLSPFLAKHFQANELEIGFLMASYSITQFLFAPVWGRLSDRFGRRPILLISILGGSLSYLAIAFSPSLTWMLVSRSLAGLFAANIATAHASMADITDSKDRASGLGLIGAAFGIGFIVGPSLGSLFGYIGTRLGDQAPFGIFFPGLMAFVITFANLIWAFFALPETLPDKTLLKRQPKSRWSLRGQSSLVVYLVAVYFIINFAMPLMEVMLFPFVSDRFQWDLVKAGAGFAIVGIIMAFTQGVLVRKLLPIWGERVLLISGMILSAAAFYLMSISTTIAMLAVAMVLIAVGNGFVRPSLLGMMSLLTNEKDQGSIMGVSQSMASLGRILGPVIGGWLYINLGMGSPFFASGCVTVIGFFALIWKYKFLPDQTVSNGG